MTRTQTQTPTNPDQDFLIAMIFSARDPHYRHHATRQALKAYALVVAIEALLYLFCLRQLVHPRVFSSYSPRTAIPTAMPFHAFLQEVYALATGVLDGALPPPEKEGAEGGGGPSARCGGSIALTGVGGGGRVVEGGPGLVGPEEQEFDVKPPQRRLLDGRAGAPGGGGGGGGGGDVEIRVLPSPSSPSKASSSTGVSTPTRRR